MNYYLVAPIKIFRHGSDQLTYSSDEDLKIGQLVLIPLGSKTVPGLILQKTTKPDFTTKPITKVLYSTPLPTHLISSALWLKDYYATPLPTVLQTMLPAGIEKNRRAKTEKTHKTKEVALPLNSAQKQALKAIQENPNSTILLHGITGSGKTNIYIKLAQTQIANQKSIILLVPEIALTSQLVANFQSHFSNVILIHSQQTESERHQTWEKILSSDQPQIIIGPRSALFAPVKNLGLIIIDECHEPSYAQDQSPKYNALRLASFIAQQEKIKVVLGSATPLIQDYHIAQQKNALIELNELAVKNQSDSQIKLIDFKDRQNFTRHRFISNQLIESIESSLQQKLQTLIFHNRRGSAPLTICSNCGWQALCPNCFLPLTLHADRFQLLCHTCGHYEKVPMSCSDCKHSDILHKGLGTKYLEQEFRKLFPSAKIARFDADTASDKQLKNIYEEVKDGKYDILIGTQMIAKGFDFPKLKTLGVIQADSQLSLPDFSSAERTYQLINQVIGRANRGHQAAEIFIQSYQPDHPSIQFAIKNEYQNFYQDTLKKRQKSQLPPLSFLLKLSVTYKTEAATIKNIRQLKKDLAQLIAKNQFQNISLSQPTPAFHEHTPKGYTWQIVIKAKTRQNLTALLTQLPTNPHLHFALDPPTLL